MLLPPDVREDDGFSLMEAVVALLVLAVTAVSVAGLLTNTLDAARGNTQRTAASEVAGNVMEAVRNQSADDIPDGRTVIGNQFVDGTQYNVVQDAAYVPAAGGATCAGGGAPAYKRVAVTISWLQDGRTRTMRSDTLRALTYGNDALTGGAVAVKVLGSDGKGQPGLPVTLAPSPTGPVVGTSTTDDDGCVVFAGRTAGNYRATVTTGGYVDVDGNSIASSGEFGIVGGQTTSTTITYEKAAALAVSLSGAQDATATVPALLPMTMYNTDRWSGTQYRVYRDCTIVGGALCFTGNAGPTPPPNTVRSTAGLFPANYKFWPGSCTDAQPTSSVNVLVGGADVTNAALPLATVKVTKQSAGSVYAAHAVELAALGGRCTSGEVIALGTMTANQTKVFALPDGKWTLQTATTVPVNPSGSQTKDLKATDSSIPTVTVP
ncbi:carboxypeptidase-like regulatory domain-containing protein [Angustibacter aerolatus]